MTPRPLLAALLSLVLHAGVLLALRPDDLDGFAYGGPDGEGDIDGEDADPLGAVDEGEDAQDGEGGGAAELLLRVSVLVDPEPVTRIEARIEARAAPPPAPKAAVAPPTPKVEAPPVIEPTPIAAATPSALDTPGPPPEGDIVPAVPDPPPLPTAEELSALGEPVAPTDEEIAAVVAENDAAAVAAELAGPDDADEEDEEDAEGLEGRADAAEAVPLPPRPPKARSPHRPPPFPHMFARGAGKRPREVCPIREDVGIVRTAPRAWHIERALVDYYASHVPKLMDLAWVYKHKDKEGKPNGFRLRLKSCSILREGGLHSGDIVHSVNGIHVHDVLSALRAYFKLRKETHIQLEVERHRRAVTLHYELGPKLKGRPGDPGRPATFVPHAPPGRSGVAPPREQQE